MLVKVLCKIKWKEGMFNTGWRDQFLISQLIRKIDRSIYLVVAGLFLGLVLGMFMNFVPRANFGFDENNQKLMQVTVSKQNLETSEYLAKTLESTFHEIEHAVAVEPSDKSQTSWSRGVLSSLDGGNQIFASSHFAGEDFFKVFAYDFLSSSAFLGENTIFISEDIAHRLFNTSNGVVGKKVMWKNEENESEFIVSGIFVPNLHSRSDQFEVLFSMGNLNSQLGKKTFQSQTLNAYVMLKNGTDEKEFMGKIKDFINTKNTDLANNLFARGWDDIYADNRPVKSK